MYPPGRAAGAVSAISGILTDKCLSLGRGVPLADILEALEKLKFGAIQLTVHEGRLVQVDVTERHRYPN